VCYHTKTLSPPNYFRFEASYVALAFNFIGAELNPYALKNFRGAALPRRP
jgi:hypothetical protein